MIMHYFLAIISLRVRFGHAVRITAAALIFIIGISLFALTTMTKVGRFS